MRGCYTNCIADSHFFSELSDELYFSLSNLLTLWNIKQYQIMFMAATLIKMPTIYC